MASPRRSVLVTQRSELLSSGQSELLPHQIQLNLRQHQVAVTEQLRRFTVLNAHRRFGKTVIAITTAVLKSRMCAQTRPQVHYFAPTIKQAKRVAWEYVRELTEPLGGVRYNDSELRCLLPWGASFQLGGADDPDASRGIYSDFAVLDEPAQMAPRMWSEVVRPALSDRQGGALFIGTPKGRAGLLYELQQYAQTANDPEWIALTYPASETGVLPASELASAQRIMAPAEYAQEYECSFDAAIRGAYWADAIAQLERDGGISDQVLHKAVLPVHVVMDLGINDATACWFVQLVGDEVRLVDYAEYTNRSLPEIVADWRLRRYTYGKVVAPHDAEHRDLSTGESRSQLLRSLGCDVVVADRLRVAVGIEQGRLLLPRCRFNATRCRHGLEALRQYRSDWDDQKGVLQLRPVHDWTSHGADAFRYLAVSLDRLSPWGGNFDYSRMDGARCS